MLFELDNVVDSASPIYYFFALTLLLAVSPGAYAYDVNSQFVVYRIHQIDLPHAKLGTRGSPFSLEAITPTNLEERFIRKCAMFKLPELLHEHYDAFVDKILNKALVSGVLILFNQQHFSKAPFKAGGLANLEALEKRLMSNSTDIPIFFVEENEKIVELYEEYRLADESAKALGSVWKTVLQDSHQLVITEGEIEKIDNPMVTSFQMKLSGAGAEEQLQTYAIVAHYDAYSLLPSLSFGADSNASGLVIFLELLRLFSRLYSNPKSKPQANLLFFLSGGGKLNYFGTKKWLDENLDSNHSPKNTLFESIQYVVCLDGLADSMATNSLYMYVSKPPKPESAAGIFFDNLQKVARDNYPQLNVSLSHKKINLAEPFLSWEHERFSLRKVSAFSLSSLPTSRSIVRKSILDRYDSTSITALERSTNIIAETLSRQLYSNVKENILGSEVSKDMLSSTFEHVATVTRSQQNLLTRSKAANMILPEFLRFVQSIMRKYAGNSQLKLIHSKVDSFAPEFVLFNPISAKLNLYNVKPALFDLLITVSIVAYISLFYYSIKHFPIVFSYIGTAKHSENGLSHRSKSKNK